MNLITQLRMHLQYMAAHLFDGEVEIHVAEGRWTGLRRSRLPDRPYDPVALASALVTREQQMVLDAVSARLRDAAQERESLTIWIIVEDGVPRPEIETARWEADDDAREPADIARVRQARHLRSAS